MISDNVEALTMQVFYHPSAKTGAEYSFDKQESGHIAKVLRMREGDKVRLSNGEGCFFEATIIRSDPKAVVASINQSTYIPKRPFSVHIALAPTKNIKRTEWFIEKAVELGIEKISFFHSRYSERTQLKPQRMRKIAIAAMKQSEKARLPEITDINSLQSMIQQATESEKYIAHCHADKPRISWRKIPTQKDYLVLIGPEGGFHSDEIILAEENSFQAMELSLYRLRTETAALTACQYLNFINH